MRYINCFWHGKSLNVLGQICLLSMLRQGHRLRLFSYEKVAGIPKGIERCDAREVMPREDFLFYRHDGSAALGSNRFRYRLMKMDLGIWLDVDVLLLKPITGDDDYIFGWQDTQRVNNAVLYLASNSSLTNALVGFTDQSCPIPPFYDPEWRARLEQLAKAGTPVDVRDLPWGVHGPEALTHYAREAGVLGFAQPREVFYPVGYEDAHMLFSSQYDASAALSDATIAVHLWNRSLRRPSRIRPKNPFGTLVVEPGSFFERFAREELGLRLSRFAAKLAESG